MVEEFLAYKLAQKMREHTLKDYQKFLFGFIQKSSDVLKPDIFRAEITMSFLDITSTGPTVYNHPYQYLHTLFEWCVKQGYFLYL